MIKSRRIGLARHVARMGKNELHIEYWWEKEMERDHWEYQSIGGSTKLKWVLERYDGILWIGLIWLMIYVSLPSSG
jgi:hypothetical protein